MRMNVLQLQATVWVSLTNIILSERSQTKRIDTMRFHLHEVQKTGEKCCIVFEVRMVVTLRNRELGEE